METTAILLICLSICYNLQALPTDGNCQKRYQDLLSQAVSVESDCGEPEIYDCCAGTTVFNVFRGYYQSPIYKVHSSCKSFRDPFQSSRTRLARCDMNSDNGGWLVILRRDKKLDASGNVDFLNRKWIDYETGFGDLETEFWYGLREMHCLTQEDVDMRLDLTFTNGTSIVWTYGLFKVDGPDTNYTLHIGQAVGSPGTRSPDAITRHIRPEPGGTPFTTKDRDNDGNRFNCAASRGGWWWYFNCGYTYLTRPHTSGRGVYWYNGRSNLYVSFVEMKIRPKSCHANQESFS